MEELEFYAIIDRAYPWFPPAHDRDSIGIDLSNSAYDPDLGQEVLEQVVEGAQLAERLGYDGTLIFEQHNTPLALFGNALTGAAWLAAATENIQIGAVGPMINAYLSPVRLAEEIALVDALSGGRLTVGFPLGIGAQYHSMGIMHPVHARARFHEAVALLHRIWTEDGPFAWEGDFFHIPYVNVWPKPRQQPHPPVFIPAAGSRETIELAAKYRFTYQAILTPLPVLLRNCQLFRDLCEENGYESDRRQIAAVLGVHTAESDQQAREEIERHALWSAQNIVRFQFHESFPPGHVSQSSLRAMMSGGYRSSDPSQVTWEDMVAGRTGLIAGSPETVRQRLADITGEMGAGRAIVAPEFTIPMWLQRKSMTIFAEEVMPAFRPRGAKAVWQREPRPAYQTAAERVGREPRRAGRPVVSVPGQGRVDLY
ncbi:MAG TPA: LLM class flavin-dependent oxidoreductase [Solirubrobacteraceae bacterium]|nr:LLM class flavin-dependent oxidoreductase [Solirubrobacteraceae bacterium]